MQNLFPNTKFVLDAKTDRLMVWTRPQDHPAIKAALDQMDGTVPAGAKEKLTVYPVKNVSPLTAVLVLQQLVPEASLNSDLTASTVIARARESDHAI
jgi:hypothetical protein